MNNQTAIQVINAEAFIKLWDEFAGKLTENGNWLNKWDNNKEWTEAIVGRDVAEEEQSPLGNAIVTYFNEKLRYRKEEWKVDLVLAKAQDFENLKDLNDKEMPLDWFYPKNYEILIEHENNIESCWEEMAKLTYLRARLKVLITYNYDYSAKDIEEGKDKESVKILVGNFKRIIEQTNKTNPENPDTEYVLIVGQKTTENNSANLVWYKYAFNANGEYIIEQTPAPASL